MKYEAINLDKILDFLNGGTRNQNFDMKKIAYGTGLDRDLVEALIELIINDGYISEVNAAVGRGGKYVSLNPMGRIFLTNGGYQEEAKQKALEQTRLDRIEAKQEKFYDSTTRRNNWHTFFIIISLLMAFYSLFIA